ncbi:MAG: cytochrome b [Micavibrio sp.]|nr:cytochrome b [Micavibrio sp.]|tara:strand:+ start:414 stop:953 length:540 start_codon:yes stop_codon:yes gene_type:complete
MREVESYGLVSRINHWSVGLTFIVLIGYGFFIANYKFEPGTKGDFMMYHKSLGVLFLALVVWRILWRVVKGFPREVSALKLWELILARATHFLLLLALLVMPISGVVMNIFSGRDLAVFDWFVIPAQERIEGLPQFAGMMHHNAPYVICALIVLHIFAALKHHVIDKDKTLVRMLTGKF